MPKETSIYLSPDIRIRQRSPEMEPQGEKRASEREENSNIIQNELRILMQKEFLLENHEHYILVPLQITIMLSSAFGI